MGQIIALDSMIFIYLFEGDERYLDKVGTLFERIGAGKISAVTSIISPIEVLSSSKLQNAELVRVEISRFFQETQSLLVYQTSYDIGLLAAEFRRKNKFLRTPDALQLATAVIGGAEVFVTNDVKLKTVRVRGLSVKMIGEFKL